VSTQPRSWTSLAGGWVGGAVLVGLGVGVVRGVAGADGPVFLEPVSPPLDPHAARVSPSVAARLTATTEEAVLREMVMIYTSRMERQ
jgi:hypothetical protein